MIDTPFPSFTGDLTSTAFPRGDFALRAPGDFQIGDALENLHVAFVFDEEHDELDATPEWLDTFETYAGCSMAYRGSERLASSVNLFAEACEHEIDPSEMEEMLDRYNAGHYVPVWIHQGDVVFESPHDHPVGPSGFAILDASAYGVMRETADEQRARMEHAASLLSAWQEDRLTWVQVTERSAQGSAASQDFYLTIPRPTSTQPA